MNAPLGCRREGTGAGCTLADRQASAVACGKDRKVAGHARDVAIAAQDLVECQRLTKPDELGPDVRRTLEAGDSAIRGELADQCDEGVVDRRLRAVAGRYGRRRGGVLVATRGNPYQQGSCGD